ncbi:phospholipid carrier-dependent glycosyltransferase [Actinomadura chibensis]|uniref:Phospholipid carrier-dependent glycosyltransferase n=1 Tax=Actinomadura chibensis TaxID=392828 RepID=A0A5D0NF71_9ACTN|nr:phospholipid carrier-dependent glycosyltransferase [Actinomadura chibensis]TYB43012.1 phospholipid carrier-dependent glycosyltransferase [Actinomadura chibensis]
MIGVDVALRERVRTRVKAANQLPLWPILLGAGWLSQVLLRVALGSGRNVPLYVPDEVGYLLGGRLFAGGAVGDLTGRPLYYSGYSLLLTPANWLSDDPGTVYHIVLVINALLSSAVLPLAYLALRRIGMAQVPAYVAATLTALVPSNVHYSQFVLTDAVLPVIVLGWLLAVHSWLTSQKQTPGMIASVLAAYLSWIHVRGFIFVVVFAGLLGVAWWRRWADRRGVTVMAWLLVATTIVGIQVNDWVRSQLYPRGAYALDGLLVDRLTSLSGLGWTLSLTVGKLWYLIVSTWGIAGLGLVALVIVTVRDHAPFGTRVTAALTLVCTAGLAFATSAATPDEHTVSNFVYGRYLTCLVPVLFMAAAVLAVRAPVVTALQAAPITTAVTLAAGAIVWLSAGSRLSRGFFLSTDFPETGFLTWKWDAFRLWPATIAALLLLVGAAALIAYGGGRAIMATAGMVAAVNVAAAVAATNHIVTPWDHRYAVAASLKEELRPDDKVGVNFPGLDWRVWVLQAFQSRHGLVPIDSSGRFPLPRDLTLVVVPWPRGTVIARSWPAAPPNWHIVSARLPGAGGWVAWRRTR